MRRTLATTALVLVALLASVATALAASSPTVTTGATSSRHNTSAVLNGTVNPNGAATMYFFQWGTTTAYGGQSATHSAGSGSSPVAVHATALSLTPGTTYHYRLVATNSGGTAVGADRTFTTTGSPPPDVTTGPAGALSTSSAVVSGTINPRGAPTTWTVQYGTGPAYGVETFSGSLPAGGAPVGVSTALQGLAPATIFHYRFVARHSSTVVSYGADQQFMTFPAKRPVPGVRARTTPHRKRNRPFAFTTTGRISHPSWMPATYACTGQVRVRWFLGRRAIRQVAVPLRPDCTFTVQTVFQRHWRRPLNGFVRYLGTGYLAPASSARHAHISLT